MLLKEVLEKLKKQKLKKEPVKNDVHKIHEKIINRF